jgi:hypothetical protein
VLSARPALAEADLPFLALSDLLTEVPDQLLEPLPTPQRKALEVALLRSEEQEHPLQQRAVLVSASTNETTNEMESTPAIW